MGFAILGGYIDDFLQDISRHDITAEVENVRSYFDSNTMELKRIEDAMTTTRTRTSTVSTAAKNSKRRSVIAAKRVVRDFLAGPDSSSVKAKNRTTRNGANNLTSPY